MCTSLARQTSIYVLSMCQNKFVILSKDVYAHVLAAENENDMQN